MVQRTYPDFIVRKGKIHKDLLHVLGWDIHRPRFDKLKTDEERQMTNVEDADDSLIARLTKSIQEENPNVRYASSHHTMCNEG